MDTQSGKKDNGHQYYEMLFVYVDDILALSHQAENAIKEITAFYKAKDGSIKPPDIYLGANISRMQLPEGKKYGQLRQRRMWRTQFLWWNDY